MIPDHPPAVPSQKTGLPELRVLFPAVELQMLVYGDRTANGMAGGLAGE